MKYNNDLLDFWKIVFARALPGWYLPTMKFTC